MSKSCLSLMQNRGAIGVEMLLHTYESPTSIYLNASDSILYSFSLFSCDACYCVIYNFKFDYLPMMQNRGVIGVEMTFTYFL
jgi:hypothetical protein